MYVATSLLICCVYTTKTSTVPLVMESDYILEMSYDSNRAHAQVVTDTVSYSRQVHKR